MSETSNDQIYELLCNIHKDVGELKGTTAATNEVLKGHIEEDKRIVRAMYDTQIQPLATKVDDLRISQAKQRGSIKVWGIVGTAAASIVGGLTGLIKWH